MPVYDYARLKTVLTNARLSATQPALHQAILQIIDGTKDATDNLGQRITDLGGDTSSTEQAIAQINTSIDAINQRLTSLGSINIIEVDTTSVAAVIDLSSAVIGFTIIKDIAGFASANNITLSGTVDGVVNPVINVDFDFFHVYLGSDKAFHTW